MAFRVPYCVNLFRLSSALHRRSQAATKPRRRFQLPWLRHPYAARLLGRWYRAPRLAAAPGDPVADHRNVLMALWAARKLGLGAGDTLRYARDLILADRRQPGWSDVAAKIARDLRVAGHAASTREVEAEIARTQARVMRAMLSPT